MNTATFPHQLRQMWDTRPLRARSAPMAGVCTGFARRYQIDVALVRAALIGATVLGGLGLVVYVIAIFALPKEPDYGYVDEQRSGPTNFVLFIAAGLAVMFGGSLSASWPGAGLISLALLALGWYALHQRVPEPPPGKAISHRGVPSGPAGAWQPPAAQFPWQNTWQPSWQPPQQPPHAAASPSEPPAPTQPQPQPQPQEPQQSAAFEPVAEAEPDRAEAQSSAQAQARESGVSQQESITQEITPPVWDPLGAAPFAWDLPNPAAPPPAPVPRAPKSRITPITLGITLIAAAAMAAVNLTGIAHISPLLVASIALGILGAGLVYGAFRKAGYGLLFAAIPLAGGIVIAATASNVTSGLADAPRGDRSYTVTDAATLQERYDLQIGNLTLDMSRLGLDRDRTVQTKVGVGNTTITVPAAMNLVVVCKVHVGDTTCPSGYIRGAAAVPNSPILKVIAFGNVGNVEVKRVQ